MFLKKQDALKSAKITFTELLAPIVGKPALMSALVLMGTYASFDFPAYDRGKAQEHDPLS